MQPLGDGSRNANFKLRLDGQPEPVVLRIYEHDASLCRKEWDLLRLAGGSVPVPEVLHAEPHGLEDLPPFTLVRYVEGISLRDLRRSGDTGAMAEAAYSAGESLAAIGRATFDRPGWLGPGPAVTAPLLDGKDPTPRFVDLCLASIDLGRRMPADLRSCTSGLVWRWAPQLARLDEEARLVSTDATCWYAASPAGGGWLPCSIGSLPFPALRWAIWATSSATSALCALSPSRIFRPATRTPAAPCLGIGGGSREYWMSPPSAKA
jgi:hypothetical protein